MSETAVAREEFTFEVAEYSPKTVILLLRNYVDIRMALIDRMPSYNKPLYPTTVKHQYAEKPFGASAATPWPFMSKPRSQPIMDGKKKARMSEDLHAAAIDLEEALKTLKDEDYHLVYEYYIIGGKSLEEIAQSRGLKSRGRLHERMQRIIKKLVRVMNDER